MRVMVETPPKCNPAAAERMAFQHAAVATIEAGFDRFMVHDLSTQTRMTGIYQDHFTNHSRIINRSRSAMQVDMYHDGETGSEKALDARRMLGANWRNVVQKGGPDDC